MMKQIHPNFRYLVKIERMVKLIIKMDLTCPINRHVLPKFFCWVELGPESQPSLI
jgi:hypothetical protein